MHPRCGPAACIARAQLCLPAQSSAAAANCKEALWLTHSWWNSFWGDAVCWKALWCTQVQDCVPCKSSCGKNTDKTTVGCRSSAPRAICASRDIGGERYQPGRGAPALARRACAGACTASQQGGSNTVGGEPTWATKQGGEKCVRACLAQRRGAVSVFGLADEVSLEETKGGSASWGAPIWLNA